MLVHIITICIGFIIAYGLQQIIELFQRRRRIRKARAAELAARKRDE
jgi:predicted PurR-regulated permease PerM